MSPFPQVRWRIFKIVTMRPMRENKACKSVARSRMGLETPGEKRTLTSLDDESLVLEDASTKSKQPCIRQMTIFESFKVEAPKKIVFDSLLDAVKSAKVSCVDEVLKCSVQKEFHLNEALIYSVSQGYLSIVRSLMNHGAFILDKLECI